jgi:hypothetical protein
MPISEDFKPRWIIASLVCVLVIIRHYRQTLRRAFKSPNSERQFSQNKRN